MKKRPIILIAVIVAILPSLIFYELLLCRKNKWCQEYHGFEPSRCTDEICIKFPGFTVTRICADSPSDFPNEIHLEKELMIKNGEPMLKSEIKENSSKFELEKKYPSLPFCFFN